MRTSVGIGLGLLLLLGGCPVAQNGTSSAVSAVLAITQTDGDAPLTVTVSASGSTSTNAGALTYAWDFGDGSSSTDADVRHTFSHPGLYVIKLSVTDAAGEVGTAGQDVHVRGASPVAVIATDKSTGPRPLTVHFDGTSSRTPDDVIRDYYWDFGDGGTSRESKPAHQFTSEGQFHVTLRVVTAGGVDASTFTTITVGARTGSLQFSGQNFANLPLASAQSLNACTFEIWVNADNAGGSVASIGAGAITLEVVPASNSIRLRLNGVETDAVVTSLGGNWRHLALVYDHDATASGGGTTTAPAGSATNTCTLYVDGAVLASANAGTTLTIGQITLGNGFQGKLSEVHFWSQARATSSVLADMNQQITSAQSGLLGGWPLNEGGGQTLQNVVGAPNGTLGASTAVETADPAWSQVGPPL